MFKSAENFIREWLGTRHVYNGRNHDGLDCYGLVLKYYREVLNVALPDWKCESTSRVWISRTMDNIAEVNFEPILEPKDHCIALVRRVKQAHHIGVHYKNHILHCSKEGVTFHSRSMFEAVHTNVIYGVPCGCTAVSL